MTKNYLSKETTISKAQLDPVDTGEYVCTVRNGIGEPQTVVVQVVVERDVSVFMHPHKDIFEKGATMKLRCQAEGHPPPRIRWFHAGKKLTPSDRVVISGNDDELEILRLTEADAGEYRCEAANDRTMAVASTRIRVKSTTSSKSTPKLVIDPLCQDTPLLANCKLIVEAKLCDNRYYKKFCCRSCVKAGLLTYSGGGKESHSKSLTKDDHHHLNHTRGHHRKNHRENNSLPSA